MKLDPGRPEGEGPDPAALMAGGGDGRIRIDPDTGLNRYHSAPRPREILAYASSTANDISAPAFAHVSAIVEGWGPALSPQGYEAALESLRDRIRSAYKLTDDVAIVFAPSGTDLEYVALAAVQDRAAKGSFNILLGADEVGSGCVHSAHGRYFADQTALGIETVAGDPVPGFEGVKVDLVDIKVRDDEGRVRRSNDIEQSIETALHAAADDQRHALVHIVHGSKTGLIMPSEADLDRLATGRDAFTPVVDACQARITSEAVQAYLSRGAICFLTGSKFMGGPPFSGFALVPPALAQAAPTLPSGLATIFARAEWPQAWRGREILPERANPGLLLRLEAAIFELERFQALPTEAAERVILAFHGAIRREIVDQTPARRVAPYPPGDRADADQHPIEMRSLSTLDLSLMGGRERDFDEATGWHKALIGYGIRLGQPVKCVRLSDGRWGATLRIGLSMPQISARAGMSEAELERLYGQDMAKVREALLAVTGG